MMTGNAAAPAMALDGKVAIVTGASRRAGRATAIGLARMGADILVHAQSSREEVEETAELVRSVGRQAAVVLGDVRQEDDVSRIRDAALDAFGRIDILINNAAIRRQVPFTEMRFDEWREILGVILDGAFLCSRAVVPSMIANGGGTIVNLGGLTAHVGAVNRAHVSAAKAGLVGLTKALAMEFADKGIRVNCVAPGKIGGQRSATSGETPAMPGAATIPLGREGDVEDVAQLICAICGPAGRFMTGQTIHLNGGLYLP
ncbi:MAG: SDR family oxidoreductase [Pseudomonadota bacterium]